MFCSSSLSVFRHRFMDRQRLSKQQKFLFNPRHPSVFGKCSFSIKGENKEENQLSSSSCVLTKKQINKNTLISTQFLSLFPRLMTCTRARALNYARLPPHALKLSLKEAPFEFDSRVRLSWRRAIIIRGFSLTVSPSISARADVVKIRAAV